MGTGLSAGAVSLEPSAPGLASATGLFQGCQGLFELYRELVVSVCAGKLGSFHCGMGKLQ